MAKEIASHHVIILSALFVSGVENFLLPLATEGMRWCVEFVELKLRSGKRPLRTIVKCEFAVLKYLIDKLFQKFGIVIYSRIASPTNSDAIWIGFLYAIQMASE